MFFLMYLITAFLAFVNSFKLTSHSLECKKFHEIYEDGKDLCETLWSGAFKVVPDNGEGNTMGFFDNTNPNTVYSKDHLVPWVVETQQANVTQNVNFFILAQESKQIWVNETFITIKSDNSTEYKVTAYDPQTKNVTVDPPIKKTENAASIQVHGFEYKNLSTMQPVCNLKYYHYAEAVTQDISSYRGCQAYHESSCCAPETVSSFDRMNEIYGEEFHVDRCGPMSDSCKQFFMMENCLYECDPNAGLYRMYTQKQVVDGVAGANEWQMKDMPIKEGFCNDWYRACYNDYFCSHASGDFFECALIYHPEKTEAEKEAEKWNDTLTAVNYFLSH